MPFFDLDGQSLHYQQSGDPAAPALVLLHHATGSLHTWRRQLEPFAARFHVLAYDRPGFGPSSPFPVWPLDYMERDVDELLALLDHLHIERARLVGHSDGGAIALMAAARRPERVAAVVAEAPHVAVETPRCPDAIAALADQIAQSPEMRAALARQHGSQAAQVVARWRTRWCDPAFWTWNVAAELTAVQCPVLVIHGADDPFFSVAHSEMIAREARGLLVVLPGVGHTPHSEAPAQFTRLALDFFAAA